MKVELVSMVHRCTLARVLAAVLSIGGLAVLPIAWQRVGARRDDRGNQADARRATRSTAPQPIVGPHPWPVIGGVPVQTKPDLVYTRLPLTFEANQGQAASNVRFISRGSGFALFLTSDGATLELRQPAHRSQIKSQRQQLLKKFPILSSREYASDLRRPQGPDIGGQPQTVVRLKPMGTKATKQPTGLGQLSGRSNYFIGHDSRNWQREVPNFARVSHRGLYPGVDLVYHGNQRQLEYDFIVAPGADLGPIGWSVEGISNATLPLSVDSQGNLLVHVNGGIVRFNKPVVYEHGVGKMGLANDSRASRRFLDGRYVLKGRGQFGFSVVGRDSSQTLVIDPVLDYSTYLGGSMDDQGASVAVDSTGAAYITGQTFSANFPVMISPTSTCASCGAANPTPDAFVTKLNPLGTALVYSTYLGGSGSDIGLGIAVDAAGNAYVTGQTTSSDFPTPGAFQGSCSSCSLSPPLGDAFVAKLDPTGNISYSTYLGGSKGDQGNAIATDTTGNAYVTGSTRSSDFPTMNPLPAPNNALQGTIDAFVAKFDPNGTLLSSTFLGGSNQDLGFGIAVDSSGIYVAGQTNSNNFPTMSPFQSTFNGVADAFLSKLTPGGSGLIYSTYLGGTNNDGASAVTVDSSGNAYVTGVASSTDFPTTPGAFRTTFSGGLSDAFVAKLNSAGSGLVYSTYLGGQDQDIGNGIAVDTAGNAVVVGATSSSDFPIANPIQASYNGNQDAFVARLVPAGCALLFSSYMGGHSVDTGTGIAVDASGNTYVTGSTSSNDFPLQNPFQGATGGNLDAFVARLNGFNAPAACLSSSNVSFPSQTLTTTSSPETITLNNGGSAILNITGIVASGDFAQTNTCGSSLAVGANCNINITFSPTGGSTRTGAVTISDDAGGSPQSIGLTGVGTDFSMAISPPTNTVTAGGSASYTLTLTPDNGFNSTVALTCSGAPTASTCTSSPSSLTLNGSTTSTTLVTVTTGARSGLAAFRKPTVPDAPSKRIYLFVLLALAMLTLLAQVLSSRRGSWAVSWLRWASLAVIFVVALSPACGFTTNTPKGTQVGNYTLTITGTTGTLQHTVRVTLVVN